MYITIISILFGLLIFLTSLLYSKNKFLFDEYLFDHFTPINLKLVILDILVSAICFGLLSKINLINSGIRHEVIKGVLFLGLFTSIKSLVFLFVKLIIKTREK